MTYLLDTDHVSVLERGGEAAKILVRRLRLIAPDDYGTTIVTYEEQCRGWADRIHRAQTSAALIEGYTELKRNLSFFARIAVVEYDAHADARYIELKGIVKNKVGTKDLRIAAIALANDSTILTRNTRDFGRVPGLLFADWTV